ncbi:conserved hypothetical protein [Burkholderia ambifaria MEX-5]|uniref:Uncharacterized protein n=2 Tax=Burkholderia ambifaria TaxID=152480 RepID=B1TBK9_9BURK|nr:conserved hypothetical protein [Burkholderia ambifaria MEX-5]
MRRPLRDRCGWGFLCFYPCQAHRQMKSSPREPDTNDKARRQPSKLALNIAAVLIGLITFAIGVAWLIYSWIVDREAQYFAIPLVFSVPVIVAVAVRSFWD